MTMRVCAIIPTYDNPATIAEVVKQVRAYLPDVVVVDDGSREDAKAVLREVVATQGCEVVWRPENGGKGAAVKTGLEWARDHGYDHALQIDADLQHDPAKIPELLASIRGPNTVVLAAPVFDASAPKGRLRARKITTFFAIVETLSFRVGDPLCGFRVYPVATALAVKARGDAMDFDPEIAVRLAWAGCEIVHVPTPVIYRSAADGGVSHYRGFADTALIGFTHAWLCTEGLLRLITWPLRRLWRAARRKRG